jgi:NAD(P)-dependent dehydrogenase (short-subunit alcohol dehydrogenase family)
VVGKHAREPAKAGFSLQGSPGLPARGRSGGSHGQSPELVNRCFRRTASLYERHASGLLPSDNGACVERTATGKRPAQPAEIAPCFVFLASADARYVTGEILAVTGGTSTR